MDQLYKGSNFLLPERVYHRPALANGLPPWNAKRRQINQPVVLALLVDVR